MKTQPECVTADGGNSTLTNQDEQLILNRGVAEVPLVVLPGGADDFSHVDSQFREQNVGGA